MGVWIETIKEENNFVELKVTPYVGVWIETYANRIMFIIKTSHPTWVCGLKLLPCYIGHAAHLVTPYVGVWIET